MLLIHVATSVISKCLTHSMLIFMSLSLGKKLACFDTNSQRVPDLQPNVCLKSVPGLSTVSSNTLYITDQLSFLICIQAHMYI